ncbi:MAG: hypothetical protein ACK5YO_09765, partial [Planctomyces sp.]
DNDSISHLILRGFVLQILKMISPRQQHWLSGWPMERCICSSPAQMKNKGFGYLQHPSEPARHTWLTVFSVLITPSSQPLMRLR